MFFSFQSPTLSALALLTAVSAAALAPASSAATVSPSPAIAPSVITVLRDCKDHRDTLTVRLRPAALRAAYLEFKRGGALRTPCGLAVSSRYETRNHRPRNASVETITNDCVRGAGALTHRYSARDLRHAFRKLDHQLRTETSCPIGISSQYNESRPNGSRALLPAEPPEQLAKLVPAGTAESTSRLLARYLAVFARPRTAEDDIPGWAVNPLALDTEPTDALHARRLGVQRNLVIVPTADGYALALLAGRAAVTTGYVRHLATPAALPRWVTRAAGGLKVWAPALVGMHRVRLLTADGRWRPVSTAGDAIEVTLSKVPLVLTYLDAKNVRHYADFNFATGGQVPAPR